MHLEAFVLLKLSPDFWMFVRGIVVDDQMQLKMLGRFSIDLLGKLMPLLSRYWRSMLLIKCL
jgi:hypothetical protein